MQPLAERLVGKVPMFAPDMIGHGGRPMPAELTLTAIATDLIEQCDKQGVGRAHWFGYSMGGLIALWMAAHWPERVRTVTTLAAPFSFDEQRLDHIAYLMDPNRLSRQGNPRAAQLAKTHHPQDWVPITRANGALYESFRGAPPLSHDQLRGITQPTLILGGLRDPLVPAQEMQLLARLLPKAIYRPFAGSAHPLAQTPLEGIAARLTRFMADPEKALRADRVKLLEFRWDR
jgi:pimeloyl-ACP methyl ester carboxylesterase